LTKVDGEELLRSVSKLAAAALLARHWPKEGSRQDAALALEGGLLRAGWGKREVAFFTAAVSVAAGDEEARKRVESTASTAEQIAQNKEVTGWPTLGELVGQDVVKRAQEWLDLPSHTKPSAPRMKRDIVVYSIADLDNIVKNAPPPIISGGILEEKGRLVIGGSFKSGKSWLAMQLAIELANGMPFLGMYEVSRPLKILYLDAENGPALVYDRFSRMSPYGATPDSIGVVTDYVPMLDDNDDMAKLGATLDTFKPDVLVVDPLYRFHMGNENDSQEMRTALASLDDLAFEYNLAVVLIHHTHKPQEGESRKGTSSANELRGSSTIPGWATSILMMKGNVEEGKVTLTPKLRSARSEAFDLEFDEEMGIFRPKDSVQDEAIIGQIKERGGRVPMPELKKWVAELKGKDEKTAERIIKNMRDRGKIEIYKIDGRTNGVRLPEKISLDAA